MSGAQFAQRQNNPKGIVKVVSSTGGEQLLRPQLKLLNSISNFRIKP